MSANTIEQCQCLGSTSLETAQCHYCGLRVYPTRAVINGQSSLCSHTIRERIRRANELRRDPDVHPRWCPGTGLAVLRDDTNRFLSPCCERSVRVKHSRQLRNHRFPRKFR
jgi:hypothetical protein